MILAGDIGGTNSRLGVFTEKHNRLELVAAQTYPSRNYESLEDILHVFREENNFPVQAACFAIAGPVREGKVATTNLAWVVDSGKLADQLALETVCVINDLEAIGYGVGELTPQDLAVLTEGGPRPVGNVAIIAAGTGLGQAGCFWDGFRHRPFACEGGHTDFAPRNDLEIELLSYLLEKFERVSYERILSGTGLYQIYQFLHYSKRGSEPKDLTEVIQQQAHPAPIVKAAMEKRSEVCELALTVFVSIYGAEAGNLALKIMATGGVYIGGGIAPKILPYLQSTEFLEGFLGKGRMRSLLENFPVRVIMNDKAGLFGAARRALL